MEPVKHLDALSTLVFPEGVKKTRGYTAQYRLWNLTDKHIGMLGLRDLSVFLEVLCWHRLYSEDVPWRSEESLWNR